MSHGLQVSSPLAILQKAGTVILNNPEAQLSTLATGEETIPELVRLGEQLARAREDAGLSPDALAKRLKVEPRLLQALERGEHRELPEGVFIVALARRIAGTLNVNVEEAVGQVRQSRLMGHRPQGRGSSTAEATSLLAVRPPAEARQSHRPQRLPSARRSSFGWRWPLTILLAACGATAAWLLLTQSREPSTPAASEPGQSVPAVSPPAAPGRQEQRITPASGTATPSAPSPSADTLLLQSSEPSWIEVREANGKVLYEGTFSGEKRFPLGKGLEVIAGRPHAVRASIGSSPAAALGGVDDIRWKRFSPPGLTPAAPAAPSTTP
jgi:cytoskeleton protein RodZ